MKVNSRLLPLSIAALTLSVGVINIAHAQEQVVKIGHTGPLSGANAFAGKDNENGVRMAVDELNTKKLVVGGKTLKFELVSEDDQCDPKAGMAVAQKDAGVKYVMGPYCSGVAIPTSKIYDEGGAILSTVGSNPKVTMGGYKSVFRIIAGDNLIGSSMAQYAVTGLKAKTAGVIDDRTAFGQGLAEEFIKEAKVLGLTIVGQDFTTDKSIDFSAILTNMKGKNPDVIFYGGYAGQAGPMDKVAAGPAFRTSYKKRFNQDPDAYAASFYDQTMFVGTLMQKLNTVDSAKISAELHKANYKGVVTTYAYDANGNLQKAPITVYGFKGGMPTPVQ